MSQYDFGNLESPLSGTALINTHLEPWRNALHSMHSGTSRPSYAVAGTMWLDTTTTPWVVKVFDGAQDITLGTINASTNKFIPAIGGAVTAEGKITLPASTTSDASLNAPHGTAPTSPSNGDLWTTTAGVFTRINGVTRAQIDNSNAGQLGGFRNLLINGNFAINQRAYVSGTNTSGANQYTLDRWRVVTSGQNVTFSASGNGNQITAPAGGVEQVIESVNVGGGTYTINWNGTATCTVNGTARAKGDSFTLTANTDCTVRFTGGTVGNAQLEQGSVVTPFEYRSLQQEQHLCRRYFYAAGSVYVAKLVESNTVAATGLSYPVEMRITPTIAGGGAGFTAVANGRNGTYFYQTTTGTQSLTFTSEL